MMSTTATKILLTALIIAQLSVPTSAGPMFYTGCVGVCTIACSAGVSGFFSFATGGVAAPVAIPAGIANCGAWCATTCAAALGIPVP